MPKDPVMLLSFVNTQLRDNYKSLTELCKAFGVEEADITSILNSIDYHYDGSKNQFKQLTLHRRSHLNKVAV